MVKITIDERELEVEDGLTILEAAERSGIPIPHLCFHEAFPPEGSCRMCLVEIEGLPKLELACSTRVREGMKISTRSDRVREARREVLEFLLAEHPVDCPVCDKAGECKLQDYYQEYGLFESSFEEEKERRQKKVEIGKNLVLDQERCILCTRCVRFLREVTKTEELGVFQRGIHSEINIYNGTPVDNLYSGNLAEICPVGAITDRDFRFQTRTWFLESGPSVCTLCSRGCNIFIDHHRGFSRFVLPKRVYRVRSRPNPQINGFWICDRGRYGYHYLDRNRIEKMALSSSSFPGTPEGFLSWLGERLKRIRIMKRGDRVGLVLHTGLSNEELYLADRLFRKELGVEKIAFLDPPAGEGDGFLLTPERSPNRRGAVEIGFDPDAPVQESVFEGLELLLVFASPFFSESNVSPLQSALGQVPEKMLFTPHNQDLQASFDVVFPVALIPEKAGSLTSSEGVVQDFAPVLETRGDVLPEWKILVGLGKELGTDFRRYARYTSPDAIREDMMADIPFFRKNQ